MTKTIDDFRYNLGYKESTNNYKKENSKHFIGRYQMGEAALADTGYYIDEHMYIK